VNSGTADDSTTPSILQSRPSLLLSPLVPRGARGTDLRASIALGPSPSPPREERAGERRPFPDIALPVHGEPRRFLTRIGTMNPTPAFSFHLRSP
jgi:hypothetical protein